MSLYTVVCVFSVLTWFCVSCYICRSSGDRVFCLYDDVRNWENARASCVEQAGYLYTGDAVLSRDAARDLINQADLANVWIGGRSTPMYWNWIDENKKRIPFHYQGCYPATSGQGHQLLQANCGRVRKATDCKSHCDGYKFYTLGKRNWFWEAKCCCGNKFATERRSDKCSSTLCKDQFLCAQDHVNSVYNTQTPYVDNLWAPGHPKGVLSKRQCVVVDDVVSHGLRLKTVPCSSAYYLLCILDKTDSCNETEFDSKNKCILTLNKVLTLDGAVKACQDLQPARRSRLAVLTLGDFAKMHGKINTPAWVSATSRVWTWDTESTETKEINDNWEARDSQLFAEGRCLQMNKGGKWVSADCDHTAGYICILPLGELAISQVPTNGIVPVTLTTRRSHHVSWTLGKLANKSPLYRIRNHIN